MSETNDYKPAPHWSGYDFGAARRAYDDIAPKRKAEAAKLGLDASTLVPDELETDAEAPLIIACDETGSMGEWPKTIFSKLPYLEHEVKEYLGDDARICFAAIGDAFSDKYPLQVQPFVTEAALKTSLEKLIIEGQGGGSSQESYDLAALYFARNCHCPKAIRRPIMIFIGDEGIYPDVDAENARKWAKTDLEKRTTAKSVFAELTKKFNVYVVRKPYQCSTNDRSEADKRIEEQWISFLGPDHVVNLPLADRVVDVIFGILAKETGREDYFSKELEDRQLKDKGGKDKVDMVMTALRTIHPKSRKKLPSPKDARSVTRTKGDVGRAATSLLDDDDDAQESLR